MARTKKPIVTARNADKHVLYQKAVQSPESDAPYFSRLYRRFCGKPATLLREDFCGTAALGCAWVKHRSHHRAIGVDLHAPTLAWGRKHNLSQLSEKQHKRITLINDDVLNVRRPKADLICALNFSYFVFKSRELLLQYFTGVHESLAKDGIFVLDCYGGSESHEELEESRRCGGFTYVWEHARFNPVTSEILCHIHFKFRDGSRMQKAFTYDWRLWTLMELQEILAESGFSHCEVHWECTDSESGEGNGVFRRTTRGEAIESWVAYLIALR